MRKNAIVDNLLPKKKRIKKDYKEYKSRPRVSLEKPTDQIS